MSSNNTSFVVVPLNLLPSERRPDSTPEMVEEEKQKIRDRIIAKSNAELAKDNEAMTLVRALGSDLNINAFACNFRLSDGSLNTDVEEANYFNKRIVERLSVDDAADDPLEIPFFLTSTEFTHDLYGECVRRFKERLGLSTDTLSLFVLRNVVMSPFPTEGNFVQTMVAEFQKVVEKEVEVRSVHIIAWSPPRADVDSEIYHWFHEMHILDK